ncbi:MAG: fatty acid CoA ligase family protein [Planctomycetota bacterium]|nr:fatty acid CoA ligase family protein [Planctomycetota bacterium]
MSSSDANIAWTLTQRAESDPDLAAIHQPGKGRDPLSRYYETLTFKELEDYSNQLANALLGSGIKPGSRAVLMVRPSLEFFGLTFAVFKAGIIPVFIDPGMGVRGLGKCIEESRATAFIAIPAAHWARRLFGWGRGQLKQFVVIKSVSRLKSWGSGLSGTMNVAIFPKSVPQSGSTCDHQTSAILFTSGSTGPAKGVVYTHRIFHAQVAALRDLLAIKAGEIDLCTFPLFALFAPALGMTSVIPKMDFTRPGRVDPLEVVGPVARFQVSNLFGSPALLRRVQAFGSLHQATLPSLNRVVSAGAPVPADVIAGMKAMLRPDAQVFTPYGATESLPVACIGSDEILGETAALTAQGLGVCVGRPVVGMKVVIIPVTNAPIGSMDETQTLATGEVGEIVVAADQVTQTYDARPEANAAAKIRDDSLAPPRYRHRMGDLGYLDGQGRLWFCGRKAHRVWTEQGPLDTIPTEALFNQHPSVFRTALVGVGDIGHQRPVVCVELNPGRHDWNKIHADLIAIAIRQPHLARIKHFLVHHSFPVDVRHNSKIFREKLAIWAARRLH